MSDTLKTLKDAETLRSITPLFHGMFAFLYLFMIPMTSAAILAIYVKFVDPSVSVDMADTIVYSSVFGLYGITIIYHFKRTREHIKRIKAIAQLSTS
ncbi:MAG: hypothetical protein QM500_12455 [Methylococcales bacterium]